MCYRSARVASHRSRTMERVWCGGVQSEVMSALRFLERKRLIERKCRLNLVSLNYLHLNHLELGLFHRLPSAPSIFPTIHSLSFIHSFFFHHIMVMGCNYFKYQSDFCNLKLIKNDQSCS